MPFVCMYVFLGGAILRTRPKSVQANAETILRVHINHEFVHEHTRIVHMWSIGREEIVIRKDGLGSISNLVGGAGKASKQDFHRLRLGGVIPRGFPVESLQA